MVAGFRQLADFSLTSLTQKSVVFQNIFQDMKTIKTIITAALISITAAAQAQETALSNARSEWEKSIPKPNIKESDEYKALQGEYAAYKTMQTARNSEDYKGVKGKFFETVYGMVDHNDGAKPVKEQLDAIQKEYEEYFVHQEQPKPTFGAPVEGTMPKGDDSAAAQFMKAWGFTPKK
jgi:hypothetical protein